MNAKELIQSSTRKGVKNWYDKLDDEGQTLVDEVVHEVSANSPGTPIRNLAITLKEHLKLEVSIETISKLLSERVRNA